jgi:restriction system protein
MPVPTYDKMLRPLLALGTRQNISRRIATEAMAEEFGLSQEERLLQIPSGGSSLIGNRAGWAMTFLTKGKLIEKVARATYRTTPQGVDFLTKFPSEISVKDLQAIPGWDDAWGTKDGKISPDLPSAPVDTTPLETLDAAANALNATVREELLAEVLKRSPEFFERLVLDVLLGMGYGGSRAEAAKHLGRSGDEGIDGRVDRDPLGLDQIMVQAKRYDPRRAVDRMAVQAFIGSLAGQGVNRGVMITTSYFAESAAEFVRRGAQTKIVLIDGAELVNLMLRYRIGVRVTRQVELLAIDENYFGDE